MKHSQRICGLALALAVASAGALAAPAEGKVTITTKGCVVKPIDKGPAKGQQRIEQAFTFATGKLRYGIRYSVRFDPAKPDKLIHPEGYLGMPTPNGCNWYGGGFMFVRINGKDLGAVKLRKGIVAEAGERAIADLIWDVEAAAVRVRFAALPNDDKLFCEITLEPKTDIKSIGINLRCYPSFFTSWFKRDGDRKIKTPATTLNQGQTETLPADKNWYALYYDTIFDVAKREGHGPCAALWLPEQVQKVRFGVGSYAVSTALTCDPKARSIRLMFWDFNKVDNATALAAFEQHAEQWAKDLRVFDFTPAPIKSFDAKAELARLDELSRLPAVQKELGAKVAEFRERIQGLVTTEGHVGVLQEAELLGVVAEYREFLWELKLAALLAE